MKNHIKIQTVFKLAAICVFLTVLITGCKNTEVAQIENQNMETDILKEDTESEEIPVQTEKDDEKVRLSFEEMNYTTFLKNSKGEDVVGLNIPFGWIKDEEYSDESSVFLTNGQYSSENINVYYFEGYSNNKVYLNLPDSYLTINDDGEYDEYYAGYSISYEGDVDCPYGKAYMYKEIITDTYEGKEYTWYKYDAVIPYNNEIILVCLLQSTEQGMDLKEVLQLIFDKDMTAEFPDKYENYLKNENGDKLLGYHMPAGYQFSEYGNEQPYYMSIWKEGKSVSVLLCINEDLNTYGALYENGENKQDNVEIEEKGTMETPYGTIKLYDELVHYESYDYHMDLALFKWNGQLFIVMYSDANNDSNSYLGEIGLILEELF